MNLQNCIDRLKNEIPNGDIFIDESMKKHTSFKLGGNAKLLVEPSNVETLEKVMMIVREMGINHYVIGNGSNLLVKDGGYNGVIIKIAQKMSAVVIDGDIVRSEAGVLLSTLSKQIMASSLKNFEFASGIPGTLGGALYMNAGAYGSEMKNVVVEAKLIDERGNIIVLNSEELELTYRNSIIQSRHLIVLEVTMKLEKGDLDEIKEITKELTFKRTSKQPLSLPSAGSTFKRPEGNYAGQLIDESGLRGFRHGGAMVSDLHCGFVVNIDNATSREVLELIDTVEKIVNDKHGVLLEAEVRVIGED
ncbi:MAG: UDP-N-acetylmuramate dehydrogenase [Acidaminobacteraceae bacterium]